MNIQADRQCHIEIQEDSREKNNRTEQNKASIHEQSDITEHSIEYADNRKSDESATYEQRRAKPLEIETQ